jgi:hypothetical protein
MGEFYKRRAVQPLENLIAFKRGTKTKPAVAIGAGYFQQWPSTRLETIAATEDAAAQIDVVDSLEIGDQLRELQSGWQNRRPF